MLFVLPNIHHFPTESIRGDLVEPFGRFPHRFFMLAAFFNVETLVLYLFGQGQ